MPLFKMQDNLLHIVTHNNLEHVMIFYTLYFITVCFVVLVSLLNLIFKMSSTICTLILLKHPQLCAKIDTYCRLYTLIYS